MTLPYTLHLGDCLEVLRTIPDNSIDSIVTDPPYGLSREPDMAEVLRHWLAGDDYEHKGSGFMGKTWDSFVPAPAVWRECLRTLKPGGHLLAFFGTRTQDIGTLAIRLAGFEIRDSIAWVYGSGFPKSRNIATLDMAGEDAERWAGWGTALKPALEPIVVARKPLAGTVAQNVLAHGTGALNIDACRIQTEDALRAGSGSIPCRHDERQPRGRAGEASADRRYLDAGGTNFAMKPGPRGGSPAGRWPANLIHDGSEDVVVLFPAEAGQAALLATRNSDKTRNSYGAFVGSPDAHFSPHDAGGSAARFFYCAKTSRRDRNEGCEAMERKPLHWSSGDQNPGSFQSNGTDKTSQNHHPTVKPTDLMAYLLRLVTPPGGKVLDPYMGSGSTGKACMREGFRFIGIERDADEHGKSLGYMAIAKARIAHELERVTAAAEQAAKGSAQLDIFNDTKEPAA